MQTNATGGVKGQQGAQVEGRDAFQELDLNTFVNLLVTEMQNQDPMNPMDNKDILEQIGQIRSIESTSRLNETLQAVLLGQNMATAGNLLGRTIVGLTDEGDRVTGEVDRVSVADGVTSLHIGDQTVSLKNIAEILPASQQS